MFYFWLRGKYRGEPDVFLASLDVTAADKFFIFTSTLMFIFLKPNKKNITKHF